MNNNKTLRFYHVPKSGGTAIFNMITKWNNFKRAHPRKNHVCICWYPPGSDDIGFTIIRHPYSRFISAFYHMVDACNDQFYYRHAKESDCNTMKKMGIDFNIFQKDPNRFLRALIDKTFLGHKEANKVMKEFSIFKPQFYWLSDLFSSRVHPGIKFILNQENLEKEFTELAQQYGQNPDWYTAQQHSNKRLSPETIPLSDVSKAILRNYYKNDFKHFKFSI